MSDSESSYDDDLYDNFSLIAPSLDPLVGDDITDVNMEELEKIALYWFPVTDPREPHKGNNNNKHQEVQQVVYTTLQGGVDNRLKID